MFTKQKSATSLGNIFLVFALAMFFALLATQFTHAAGCKDIDTSVLECDDSGGRNPIFNLLLLVLNIMTGGVGIVAVGGIIYGAILYATAQDNSSQVQKAKGIIGNVVLGIIAFGLMFAFLQYLIPGGVFN